MHLEGALGPELLVQIDPSLPLEDARAAYRFQDFPGFLQAFKFAVMRLRTPDHYRLLARHLFAQLAAQNIVYAEIIHSAGINLWRGLDAAAILRALIDEGRRAPLEIRWIVDAVRQFGGEHALSTARLAAGFAGGDVIAFGVGGDETGAPVDALLPAFDYARSAGLRLTAHAGETSNAQNVWDALALNVDRIGHGIRSIDDPALLAELRARGLPLEISLSSNVRTGAVSSLSAHPAKRLHDAGVALILNTDDPAFFGATLAAEFAHAASLGFSEGELDQLRRNAFRFAFAYRGPAATAPRLPSQSENV